MTLLTSALAPTIHPRLIAAANRIAEDGRIAIVGRAAPWGEVSPSHRERFAPHAFMNAAAPLLLTAHNFDSPRPDLIADGVDADSSRYGFDAVWVLRESLSATDDLFDHLADGTSGLSVEMRVDLDRVVHTWATGPVRDIVSATVFAVAVVENPSCSSARIHHVATPGVLWSYDPTVGRLSPTGNAVAAYLDARDRGRAADRTRESAALTARIADALAGRTYGASAIRSTHDHDAAGPVETFAVPLDTMIAR